MPGQVDHVVNFDFPLNPVDYIHRTGRDRQGGARQGRSHPSSQSVTLCWLGASSRRWRGNLPLDELSAAKSVLPPNMR